MISDGSVSLGQNTDAAKPKATVATVGGEPFYDWDLTPVQGQLSPPTQPKSTTSKSTLDSLIEPKLLENAAKEKGITTDKLLQQEVDAKPKGPSDDEIPRSTTSHTQGD